MNEHEELLTKALVCLSEAPKIEDTALRAKVLDLVYQAQQVAQAAVLQKLAEVRSNSEPSAEGATFAYPTPPTNPKARV